MSMELYLVDETSHKTVELQDTRSGSLDTSRWAVLDFTALGSDLLASRDPRGDTLVSTNSYDDFLRLEETRGGCGLWKVRVARMDDVADSQRSVVVRSTPGEDAHLTLDDTTSVCFKNAVVLSDHYPVADHEVLTLSAVLAHLDRDLTACFDHEVFDAERRG